MRSTRGRLEDIADAIAGIERLLAVSSNAFQVLHIYGEIEAESTSTRTVESTVT